MDELAIAGPFDEVGATILHAALAKTFSCGKEVKSARVRTMRGGGFVPLSSEDPARSLIHAYVSFAWA
jgi:hypothetical protein